jgi:hypothetical protein
MSNENQIIDKDDIGNGETEYIIGVDRFVFLYIVTFGMYGAWWTYKSWTYYKIKDNLDIMPAARAIFSIFFLNELFHKIQNQAKESGYEESFLPELLFIGFIVFNLTGRLPEPYWMISLLGIICLIQPFKALNYAKQHSKAHVVEQESFNQRQMILVVVCLFIWALVIIGLLGNKNFDM